MSSLSEDGWNLNEPLDYIFAAYQQLDKELTSHPIEKHLKEPEILPDPRRIQCPDEQVIYFPPDDDSDDEIYTNRKPTYFRPPLQVQRNQFVRDTLKEYIKKKNVSLKKLAILGCGESSLERFLDHELGPFGIERVLSVDIEETCLAKGIQFLRNRLKEQESSIKGRDYLPCLVEHFLGDILTYDERLVHTDCVCSTEVIEHISVEEAEIFVRLVLDQIQPKLFILSTPNHEYNKAFGMEPGTFRHDDHKYEFTREEFKNWITKILIDSGTGYKYDIHYVGNMTGFYELQGATQFAVFFREGNVADEPYSSNKFYEKAAHTIICGGLYNVLIKRSKVALKSWLKDNKLDSANLTETEFAKFWEIPLIEIFNLMELPHSISVNVDRQKMLEMLKALSRGRLFAKYGGPNADDSNHFIIVPHDCRIEDLICAL